MLIRTVVAPLLGTNCYLVQDDAGRSVVVDPGLGVTPEVLALVEGEELEPLAVLATHGHLDHTWAAAELCAALDVPFVLHADDAYRLADPFGSLGPLGHQLEAAAAALGQVYREPERVMTFTAPDDDVVPLGEVLGLGEADRPFDLTGLHAPGHTEGSTLYLCSTRAALGAQAVSPGAGEPTPVAFTGDVLFAGSVGRTDLPGGDDELMQVTLARVAALDARTLVLSGHGPSSRLSDERRSNPYLRVFG